MVKLKVNTTHASVLRETMRKTRTDKIKTQIPISNGAIPMRP